MVQEEPKPLLNRFHIFQIKMVQEGTLVNMDPISLLILDIKAAALRGTNLKQINNVISFMKKELVS
jgi:hypothetical protein